MVDYSKFDAIADSDEETTEPIELGKTREAGNALFKQKKYADDFGPIDPSQPTIEHSRAYLHHLFKQHEPLFMTLASLHNLIFMNKLMAGIRERIMRDEI